MVTTDTNADALLVDCRGMQCPAPILRLAETARKFKDNPQTITVLATDEDFPMDLEAWCRSTKATITALTRNNGEIRALVALAGASKPANKPAPTPPATAAPAVALASPALASPAERTIVDVCGLTAVQAIRRLGEITTVGGASSLRVIGDAPGIDAKIIAWASANEAEVESVRRESGKVLFDLNIPHEFEAAPAPVKAPVVARPATREAPPAQSALATAPDAAHSSAIATVPDDGAAIRENRTTILVLKNDLEGLLAAMMCANAAAAQGMKVDMFFSFWAVHLLRGEKPRKDMKEEPVGFIGRMMKWMVPSGPGRQQLAKLRMGGMGTRMLNWLMRKRNILTLEKLIEQAVQQDVRFVVCSMSMGLMGLTKRDIVDLPNVDFAGVASFMEHSRRSSVALVF
ncbi:MAG: DsrE/DsrF/DrsH-like family protein [Polyangiales bacterium]